MYVHIYIYIYIYRFFSTAVAEQQSVMESLGPMEAPKPCPQTRPLAT